MPISVVRSHADPGVPPGLFLRFKHISVDSQTRLICSAFVTLLFILSPALAVVSRHLSLSIVSSFFAISSPFPRHDEVI
jgi:hypothetical protein